jgi:hypothetical protein
MRWLTIALLLLVVLDGFVTEYHDLPLILQPGFAFDSPSVSLFLATVHHAQGFHKYLSITARQGCFFSQVK